MLFLSLSKVEVWPEAYPSASVKGKLTRNHFVAVLERFLSHPLACTKHHKRRIGDEESDVLPEVNICGSSPADGAGGGLGCVCYTKDKGRKQSAWAPDDRALEHSDSDSGRPRPAGEQRDRCDT